jgi:uncharacterized membrane protein YtjA (UPF0391 family)
MAEMYARMKVVIAQAAATHSESLRALTAPRYHQSSIMLHWAIIFFIIAIVASILGFSGLSHETAGIAKILAVIGIIFAVVSFAVHRRSRRD